MHEQEQQETVVYAHMHGPFEEILLQHFNLQQDIKNEYFKQGKNSWAEERQGEASDECEDSLNGRNVSGLDPNAKSKPGRDFVEQAKTANNQRYVKGNGKKHMIRFPPCSLTAGCSSQHFLLSTLLNRHSLHKLCCWPLEWWALLGSLAKKVSRLPSSTFSNPDVASPPQGKTRQSALNVGARRLGQDEQYLTVREILSETSTLADGALSCERSDFCRFGYAILGLTSNPVKFP
jgi:hypothetical protein